MDEINLPHAIQELEQELQDGDIDKRYFDMKKSKIIKTYNNSKDKEKSQ